MVRPTSPTCTHRRSMIASVSAIALAATGLACAPASLAQETGATADIIIVTGSRRESTVQDVPLNIAAIDAVMMEEQGLSDLPELSTWVPGVHILDQGARGADRIVVRGLNADPLQSAEFLDNGGGDTVATYVGDIPLYIDLKLNDMQRVEFLLGPQGTLYGAGTMGGAIRYIPNRPDFDSPFYNLRGDSWAWSQGDGLSTDFGVTFNLPISDNFAVRGVIDRLDDNGFIDYGFLVREPGVSDPDPDFGNPADITANLRREADVNWEKTTSGRLAFRWAPTNAIDARLTWYFQDQQTGGRTASGRRGLLATGDYVFDARVLEPNNRENQLLALEVTADLGFAELTSATGVSRYVDHGQRDQTDLLITLEYSYEAFPRFTAFVRETHEEESASQELRLVSNADGPFQWIVGGFYRDFERYQFSEELAPGFDLFALNVFGAGGQPRPDNVEYTNVVFAELTETALFGEAQYWLNDTVQITLGARRYDYELSARGAFDLPLFRTVFLGEDPDSIIFNFTESGQEHDGWLYKLNASWRAGTDVLLYATLSEGYRVGDNNGIPACPVPLPVTQVVCALPDEAQHFPDKTLNHELGIHSRWLDGALTLNGAIYYIDWQDPQIVSATVNGAVEIYKNGDGARSMGLELSFDADLSDRFSLRGTYTYNNTELTAPAPDLIRTITPPGFGDLFLDGLSGDRLPGFPEHQASLFVNYNTPLNDGFLAGGALDASWSVSWVSDIETRTGGRADGVVLDGYAVQNAALTLSRDNWRATLYARNLLDEFAETGVRGTPRFNQVLTDNDGGPVYTRRHFSNVLPPRMVGFRISIDLDGG